MEHSHITNNDNYYHWQSSHCMLAICINNITLDPPNDGLFLLLLSQDSPGTNTGQTAGNDVNPPLGGEVRQ